MLTTRDISRGKRRRVARLMRALVPSLLCLALLAACGGGGGGGGEDATPAGAAAPGTAQAAEAKPSSGTTDGPSFAVPSEVALSPSSLTAADATDIGVIDTSNASKGYVTVCATGTARLKFQVISGEMSYNYDIPLDGTPITVPLNMGDGAYSLHVMQNTSGSNYVELQGQNIDVKLDTEFDPFVRPNMFCNYDASSKCVAQARELVAGAANEGDALQAVCDYITSHVTYDHEKAEQLATTSGYVPDPDETLSTGKGICFDYASLGAAMLRSLGIPCRVVTGYVSPDDIYHAWIVVYIDGSWRSAQFSVDKETWTRIDLTFAAASDAAQFVGDGKSYTERYTY